MKTMTFALNKSKKRQYMTLLTLANVLPYFYRQLHEMQYWQITETAHPDYGAIVNPDYGIADPKATGKFIVGCAYLALAQPELEPTILERAVLTADYLLKAQRPSGLIDLLSVNYDSSPDTGFTVQELGAVLELGRRFPEPHPAWPLLLEKLEQF